jgi:acyl-CoA thioesterase-1
MILPYGWFGLLVAGALLGCGGDTSPRVAAEAPPRPATERGRIVFLGTSLTAGLGVDPGQAYPALIQTKLDAARLPFEAVNAGVSGETSAGALRRLDWLMRQPVSVLVIETGANDGLRGLDPDSMRANIQAMIDRANQQSPRPRIVLTGMRALPNYGFGYARRFREVYSELAEKNELPLVPFLLQGVAGQGEMNQEDMIHPNPSGHRLIAENVWKVLEPVLEGR